MQPGNKARMGCGGVRMMRSNVREQVNITINDAIKCLNSLNSIEESSSFDNNDSIMMLVLPIYDFFVIRSFDAVI